MNPAPTVVPAHVLHGGGDHHHGGMTERPPGTRGSAAAACRRPQADPASVRPRVGEFRPAPRALSPRRQFPPRRRRPPGPRRLPVPLLLRRVRQRPERHRHAPLDRVPQPRRRRRVGARPGHLSEATRTRPRPSGGCVAAAAAAGAGRPAALLPELLCLVPVRVRAEPVRVPRKPLSQGSWRAHPREMWTPLLATPLPLIVSRRRRAARGEDAPRRAPDGPSRL